MSLKKVLDADWARLQVLAGKEANARPFFSAFSPRFAHIVLIRWAHSFHGNGWRRLSKLVSLTNFFLFGIEVPARLEIGPGLVIPHTQGTILGAARIGRNVTIYQQVTLGAKMGDYDYDLSQRPVVEDGAIITAGAKVLGPIVVGKNSIVGANAVVLNDVPEDALALGVPARMALKERAEDRQCSE